MRLLMEPLLRVCSSPLLLLTTKLLSSACCIFSTSPLQSHLCPHSIATKHLKCEYQKKTGRPLPHSKFTCPPPATLYRQDPKKGDPAPPGASAPLTGRERLGLLLKRCSSWLQLAPRLLSGPIWGGLRTQAGAHFCSPPSVKMRTINRRYSYSQTPYKGRHGSVYKRAEK